MIIASVQTRASEWWAEARANPLFVRGMLAAAAVAAADQASKFWIINIVELPLKRRIEISSIFDLSYVCNRGASFGMLAGGTASRILLVTISIVIASVMVVWLARLKRGWAAAGGVADHRRRDRQSL